MKITRRDFIKSSIILGGSILLPRASLLAARPGNDSRYPGYGLLEERGELARRIEEARSIFEECRLCPRECGVNRLKGEEGFCRAGAKAVVASANAHYGEELSLVGEGGSGTIFFSNCNLRCIFCQNWPIAHRGEGSEATDESVADMMLYLQKIGCHNINLVTPTHVMPNILRAARIAFKRGLRVPLVYNTSGYERVEILRILDGIVDIYLPDMKYMDGDNAAKYSSGASDYPGVTKDAIVEMHRQVGVHRVNERGVAVRGLMIRHLVMPNRVAGTREFVRWVAGALPRSTYVNIMHQYHVAFRAFDYPEISRSITAEEYLEAVGWAEEEGLTNLDPRSVVLKELYLRGRVRRNRGRR